MFDIGDTEDIKVGDQVELIGPHLPLKEWAKLLNTISYELLTSLNLRLPKVYTRDL
jgi:alanine racemase